MSAIIKLTRPDQSKSIVSLKPSALKEKIFGAAGYSAESSDLIAALADNSFEAKADLGSIANNLKAILEPNNKEAEYQNKPGMIAASFVSAFAGNPEAYLQAFASNESKQLGANTSLAQVSGLEFDSVYSKESFDNQTLNEHLGISIGLNYKIARQGPAMEMVYRTIPLTPDTGGIDIEVPNLYVQNTLRHSADGSAADFGLRRVIDSSIDYRVLNDNSTKLIPQVTTEAAANFVAAGVVAPFDHQEGRRLVKTSALVLGREINLFGVSQADTMQRVGQSDYTEALDRNVGIESAYLTLGADTLRFDTKGLPYSRFVKGPEQGARSMILSFPLTTLTLDKNSTQYDGDALAGAIFTTIKNGGYKVRLSTTLTGSLDVERGGIEVNASQVRVLSIVNEAGDEIPLTTGTVGPAIVSGLASLKVEGWWPDARLTNTNHRHLGLMLNVRPIKERLLTRVRSPFFVPYPLGEDRDQTVMDWLTFAVSSYINNEAVGTMIGYHERLMRLTGGLRGEQTVGDFELNSLPIEGIARYLINPYVQTVQVNLLEQAQSQETVANVENGQEVLLNVIRSLAFDILQRTNYENACRFVDGGEMTKQWDIALVTSKKIERFMQRSGDSRTLGAGLSFQLEGDVDARLSDSMYMTLVRKGEGLDILSSGVMLLTPTLVSTISVTRDSRPANEAVVQPRFQHYNLLPIIVKLEVTGVDELLEQTLPFRIKDVTPATGGSDTGTGAGTGGTTTGGTGGVDSGAGA